MRLLVVEDDPTNADLYRILFKQLGQVRVVDNGPDALAACDHTVPDLVIMDAALLGEMDGIEVTRRIRANRSTRDVPIVFVTACVEREASEAAFGAGANAIYRKPFSPKSLATEVVRLAACWADSVVTPLQAKLLNMQGPAAAREFLLEQLRSGQLSEAEFRELAEWATGFFLRVRLAEPEANEVAGECIWRLLENGGS
ncbi:MAG: response regulator [Cyanobacteria bacterium REEB65]|nr:response regulator [Cyanobacteria bacterium REEB65]